METEKQVECRLLLDVVVRQCAAILKLLTSKDQALLIRRDALLGPVRLAETWLNWLKNTVLAELLWEKNTVPAEKTS